MAETTIRVRWFIGHNDGTESCDFRGDKFEGSAEGDEHGTIAELDLDDADPLVEAALREGPGINKWFAKLESTLANPLGGAIGKKAGLRFEVTDKVPIKD